MTPEGLDTRPTTDRIKETLFNMLQDDVPGSRFLDLFAGSGGIGIEALSRGASEAVFVEYGREPVRCIRANLDKTGLSSRARVLPMELSLAVKKLASTESEPFHIIFADPPYQKGWEAKILRLLSGTTLVGPDTQIVIEASLLTDPDDIDTDGYDIVRIKRYKTNQHIFLRLRTDEGEL